MSAADLAIIMRLQDEASAGFDKLSSKLGGLGGIVAGGVAAAGAAVAAGVAIGVKSAGDLEQSVANISTIKPDIDTSGVFASLNEMSTRIPATAASLGDSLYNVFSSMSVSSEEALGLVETFARGAVGAQTDAETFGTSIMGVLNAYGLAASDASHVSDVFFNTVNAGVVTGQELASSLGPVTQAAKAAGVSVDELGGFIAGVTKEGGPAAQNINNLNNFLQKITTGPAQAQLRALGIATTDATGAFRPTTDVLTDLKAKLGGMTESARANALQAIFPDAQARQGAAVLLSQLDFVKETIDTNKEASGSAAAAYEKMSATFNSQSKLAMNAIMAMLTTVGAQILPMLTPLLTAFSQWLPGAFQQAQAVVGPFLTSFIAQISGLATTVGPAIGLIVSAFQGLMAILSGDGDTALGGIDQLLSTFSPETAGIIIQFGSLARQGLELISAAAAEVGAFVVEQFGFVVSWFQENWPLIQKTIATVLANIQMLWDQHGQTVITVVQSLWTIVKTAISFALQSIGNLLKLAMQLITGDWQGAWETVKDQAQLAWDAVTTILGAALTAIAAIFDDATGGLLTKTAQWLTDTSTAISDGLTWIQDAWSSGWQAVNDFAASIWPTIRDAIVSVWHLVPEDIRSDAELILTTLIERGAAWVDSMVTAGSNMLTAVTTWLADLVTAATTWATSTFLAPFQGLVTSASTEATNVGQGVLSSIQTKLGEVISWVTGWLETFLAPIRGLISTVTTIATDIGQAIVNGVITGITSIGSRIGETLTRLARGALQAAKDALDIKSPSGKGEDEVGVPLGEGVLRGVERMRAPIAAALRSLVQLPDVRATTPLLATAGGYGGPSTAALGPGTASVYFAPGAVVVQGTVVTERDLTETIGQSVIASIRDGRLG